MQVIGVTLRSKELEDSPVYLFKRLEDFDINEMTARIDGLQQSEKTVEMIENGFTISICILENTIGGSSAINTLCGKKWRERGLYDLVFAKKHRDYQVCLPLSVVIGFVNVCKTCKRQHNRDY